MLEKILTVKNVTVNLSGQTILQNLSLDLEKGTSLAIIGPNGSGKTVFLKTLLGIIPYDGQITWAKGVRIGYVPQKIEADRHLPLNLENLLRAKSEILKLRKSEIYSITETVGLSPKLLKTPIGYLSGGQFQKALIAFALLGKPNVILFDEPTASLDQLTEENIYELINELHEKQGLTTILVSHDLSVVYRYAHKVLCLNKENVCYGTPEKALNEETLKKLYGAPHKYHHHHHDN